MDDSPDKLRRNVMLIGAIIISILMFDLTIKTSGSILGIIQIGNISPLKLWLSLSVLLIYFFLRYIYSEQATAEIRKIKQDIPNLRIKAVNQLLHKQIGKYLKTGKHPSCLATPLPPRDPHKRHLRVNTPKFKTIIATLENYSTGTITVKYTKSVNYHASQTVPVEHKDLAFIIPWHHQSKILLLTLIRTTTISKSSVDFLTPLAISLISVVACAYKIANLLFHYN